MKQECKNETEEIKAERCSTAKASTSVSVCVCVFCLQWVAGCLCMSIKRAISPLPATPRTPIVSAGVEGKNRS